MRHEHGLSLMFRRSTNHNHHHLLANKAISRSTCATAFSNMEPQLQAGSQEMSTMAVILTALIALQSCECHTKHMMAGGRGQCVSNITTSGSSLYAFTRCVPSPDRHPRAVLPQDRISVVFVLFFYNLLIFLSMVVSVVFVYFFA